METNVRLWKHLKDYRLNAIDQIAAHGAFQGRWLDPPDEILDFLAETTFHDDRKHWSKFGEIEKFEGEVGTALRAERKVAG
jgi:hypothetical protein